MTLGTLISKAIGERNVAKSNAWKLIYQTLWNPSKATADKSKQLFEAFNALGLTDQQIQQFEWTISSYRTARIAGDMEHERGDKFARDAAAVSEHDVQTECLISALLARRGEERLKLITAAKESQKSHEEARQANREIAKIENDYPCLFNENVLP